MTNLETKTEKAIIAVGGKQHLVAVGTKFAVNRLKNAEGETITEQDLLSPKKVNVKVLEHILGKKIHGLKFHRKVRYTRHYGHRQHLTMLEVVSIGEGNAVSAPKKAEVPVKEVKTELKSAPVKAEKTTSKVEKPKKTVATKTKTVKKAPVKKAKQK